METVPNPDQPLTPPPLWVSSRQLGRPSRPFTGPRRRNIDRSIWWRPEMRSLLAQRDLTNVYRLLQQAGASQRWIAAQTGHSQSEVSEIVGGRRRVVSYDVLLRIALGLDLPRGWLGLDYDPDTIARFLPDRRR